MLIAHAIPEDGMAGDADDGQPAKAKPHPPIRSEFGRRFARALKVLEQVSVDSFDRAFGEAKRLFRERYDAEIHVDGGFMRRVLGDAAVRRSLVDVVEALESLLAGLVLTGVRCDPRWPLGVRAHAPVCS